MLNTCLVAMLLFAPLAFSQQCRQVTVCNEESSNFLKGDKGDVGSPGKAGPVGSRGPKGEVGGVGKKGMQGESCALGSFESTLMSKLEGKFVGSKKCENKLDLLSKLQAVTLFHPNMI